jgi:hypothetical protein
MAIDNTLTIDDSALTVNMPTIISDDFTMSGNGKAWEDLRIEPTVRLLSPTTNNPTWTKFVDNGSASRGLWLYAFDYSGTEKELHFTAQMPHAWDGGDIHIHVHWIGSHAQSTATPKWGLEYSWAEAGTVFANSDIIYTDGYNYTLSGTDPDVTINKHYISKWASISPDSTDNGLSSIIMGRVFRNSSDGGDTYTQSGNLCGLLYIDLHYQIDAFGSSLEYTK